MKGKMLVIAAAAVALTGCSVPKNKAENLLAANGYTDIQLGGPDLIFNSCKGSDDLSRVFTARAANGAPVKGVVCSGMFFRGAVIRLTDIGAPDPAHAGPGAATAVANELKVGQTVAPAGDKAAFCAAYDRHKAEQPLAFMDDYCGAI